jgi:ABC-type branched-subunit amino acid transport system substrate-binding protein
MRAIASFLSALIAAPLMLGAGDAVAQNPIKIGFISPISGAIAQAGKDMYNGCELYWEESGWQIAGRKLEVILEDNEELDLKDVTWINAAGTEMRA